MIKKTKYWWKLLHFEDTKGVIAGLAAHSGQISVGLAQGYSAILVPKLVESNFASISESSWIASLGVISNPLGALIAGSFAEWFGRRSAIAFATLPHAAGWLIIALSTNVTMLCTGRFISGIGTGMANGLYLYVSEAAAPHQRAWLSSCGPVLVSLGVLIIYSLGAVISWQRAAVISIVPAILSLALVRLLPETPAWLVSRGKTEEAKKSLYWLRGTSIQTETEYENLCHLNKKPTETQVNLFKSLLEPCVWKPFLILLTFFALQQLTGIYIILFYTVNLLDDIGVTLNEYVGSVGVGVIRLFASILGAALATSVDRRVLAAVSGLGMAFSSTGIALSMRYSLPSWIPLVCVGSHVAFSMIGYLTLPWVMTSELYPLKFRGTLSGLTTSIAQILTFAAIKTYPDINRMFGLETTLWIFSVAGFAGTVFALVGLPETRNCSLDQIESRFSSKSNLWSEDSKRAKQVPELNVTLKNFTYLGDEDLNKMNSLYSYDNFCFKLNLTDDNDKSKNQTTHSETDNRSKVNQISTISLELEHAYL